MNSRYPVISLRRFGFDYENLPAFHAAYFMLILIFAGIFHLGFFAALIGLHIIFDFVRYFFVLRLPFFRAIHACLRESLADIALFSFALAASVYLNATLPFIATLTGSARMRMTVIRGLIVLLPKLSILHHFLRITFRFPEYLHSHSARIKHRWTMPEKFLFAVLLLSIASLSIAPNMLHLTVTEIYEMMAGQLTPWKF